MLIEKINETFEAPKDLIAGLIFIILGTVLFFASQNYDIGSARRMGPGYFPALLGLLLVGLGLAAFVKGLRAKTSDPLPHHQLTPLLMIFLSIVSFAFFIERAGLVVASTFCIAFACYRRLLTKPIELLIIFLGLTVFNVVVFIKLFELPLRIFWWN
jgi:Tripartite tricarboxylate transporter TctB family